MSLYLKSCSLLQLQRALLRKQKELFFDLEQLSHFHFLFDYQGYEEH